MKYLTVDEKLELLNLYMSYYIDWIMCKDQLKFVYIKTKFGDFNAIISFEKLLERVMVSINYPNISILYKHGKKNT